MKYQTATNSYLLFGDKSSWLTNLVAMVGPIQLRGWDLEVGS